MSHSLLKSVLFVTLLGGSVSHAADLEKVTAPASPAAQARRLVAELREELREVEDQLRNVPYLPALERGEVSRDNLRAFAGEQYHSIRKDLRSGAMMLSRFGTDPATRKFFQDNVDGEVIALGMIIDFGKALGLTEADLEAYQPRALAQAYPSFVTAFTLQGSEAEVAASYLVNFPVFGENTARMGAALRSKYGLSEEDTAFFDFFGGLPPNFEPDAMAAIESGLANGADPFDIKRSARLLQAYELFFWQAVADNPK